MIKSIPNSMSHDEYKMILRDIISTGRYCDYADALSKEAFIVLRHDVEFSPERAFQMHEIENSLNFKSSYFFQITNNIYNAFSQKNLDIINKIHENGHFIGLHYHMNGKTDITEIKEDIKKQAKIMSEVIGIEIDRFSIHRPTKGVLRAEIEIEGLINTYSPMYFTFAEEIKDDTKLEVKYIVDSMHRWNYGFPDREMLSSYPKIQILIHPYSWTDIGYDSVNNFKTLINEKSEELIISINSECKHLQEVWQGSVLPVSSSK